MKVSTGSSTPRGGVVGHQAGAVVLDVEDLGEQFDHEREVEPGVFTRCGMHGSEKEAFDLSSSRVGDTVSLLSNES
jgi:hypothetical protein